MSIADGFIGRVVVVRDPSSLPNRFTGRMALVDATTGLAWTPGASEIKLTGYAAVTAGNVAASDTVNAAIAKLEARIAALEAA
jgi:hypothetical protein